MSKGDFEYSEALFKEFFHRRKIQTSIGFFEENEITGWEKWFQLEFARFLYEHEGEPEWWIESSLEFDRRMEKRSKRFRADLLLRKKGWKNDTYTVIEMKQNNDYSVCVTSMVDDLNKLSKAKDSELDTRNIVAVGVYKKTDKMKVKQNTLNKLKQSDWEPEELDIKSYLIPNTGYGFTLIGYDYA
jgi:hypothetical protein